MGIISLPELTVALAKWRISESREHKRDINTYYVTDLDSCALKRLFETELQDVILNKSINGRLMFGTIVHYGILTILKEIFGDRIATELDTDLNMTKTIVVDGREIKIEGRIDAILDNRYGIEIKSHLGSSTRLPFPWHESQASAYNWLYGLDYTILLYITPIGIYQYLVDKHPTEREIIEIITTSKSPRYEWECKYCPFQSLCHIGRSILASSGGDNSEKA